MRKVTITNTVNHSRGEWVNLNTECTTNHLEAFWGRAKDKHKERKGTHRSTVNSHMVEFMLMERFKGDFLTFVTHIKMFYGFDDCF